MDVIVKNKGKEVRKFKDVLVVGGTRFLDIFSEDQARDLASLDLQSCTLRELVPNKIRVIHVRKLPKLTLVRNWQNLGDFDVVEIRQGEAA